MQQLVLKITTVAVGAAVIGTLLFVKGHSGPEYLETKWAFEGPLGKVDRPAAQRGFQIYREVCASCHSLKQVAYRNLTDIGFTEDEVKAIAASVQVQNAEPDEAGDMFMRAGKPSDKFVSPFANEQAARASNGGAFPPDLSLIVKARHDGPNYIYSLLQGYKEAPACIKAEHKGNIYKRLYASIVGHEEEVECRTLGPGMHYNEYFGATQQIAMPAPLVDGGMDYQDGTEATLAQEAHDVVTFLQWAAEPDMESRKQTGVAVLIFLGIFTVLFLFAKKATWKRVH